LSSVEAIYAIAATGPGESLLRRLGFQLLKPAGTRRDFHNLFCAKPAIIAKKVLEVCERVVTNDPILKALSRQGL
jgi:hypothetical protein